MQKLRQMWDEDPELLAFVVFVAGIVLVAAAGVYFASSPPPEPEPIREVEIVPEPHVLTQSDLRWDLLERWPGASSDEEAVVVKAALEEDDAPAPRRRHHRHWRRW